LKDRLKRLYQLQEIDKQLDELESLRGDLPGTVSALEAEMEGQVYSIEEKKKKIEQDKAQKEENESEMIRILDEQKKFRAQLVSVRNNKEYDAMTKQIDRCSEDIQRFEKENAAITDAITSNETDVTESLPRIETKRAELEEKKSHLLEIIQANEVEEQKLRTERAELQKHITPQDFSLYNRIRTAKKGLAVVTIDRDACTGCHNVVPAQRQLEIRRNNRVFNCEYCGRILVSAEISGLAPTEE